MRGLKRIVARVEYYTLAVAPYVGAWIETLLIGVRMELIIVAPYVGAWIETDRGQKQSP